MKAGSPHRSLVAALLGFFIITLDALVVSVALPAIRADLGGGITGLQWVMDGYTLPFAAGLLIAGMLSDRLGARKAFGLGLLVFVASSALCAFAQTIGMLVAARMLQGAGAAMMTPASQALIGEAYPDPAEKARAVGFWAVGGAVALAAGPLVGGALTMLSWKLIFLINLPIGAGALWLLSGVPASRRHQAAFDWTGQATALIALTALTFGLIEAGESGLSDPVALGSLATAAVAGVLFFVQQARGEHPMVPLSLFQSRAVTTAVAIGFSFMVGFYGMVFLVSLLLQQQRGLTPFQTGLAFLPVTGFSILMPVVAARMAERFGAWVPIVIGQATMAAGLFALSLVAATASIPVLILAMVPVGFGAGTAMPTATSLLLNSVPRSRFGTASGVLNTSRQVGGAMAIAAFGALVAARGFGGGMQLSCVIAATLLLATMLGSFRLKQGGRELQSGTSQPAASTRCQPSEAPDQSLR